jgi:uncharacterized protein (DUF427 family)
MHRVRSLGITNAGSVEPRLVLHQLSVYEEVQAVSHREVLEPSAGHPITIEPTKGRVQVRVNGELVADTTTALELQEATLPAVQYIPFSDVVQDVLIRTDTSTYCPFKGDASYYSVTTASGETVDDVIWTYEEPYPAVAAIAGHVAFYPNKAEISVSAR